MRQKDVVFAVSFLVYFLFILFILIFLLILILLFDSFDLWVYKALHRLIGTVKRGLFFGLDFWILGVCPGFKI